VTYTYFMKKDEYKIQYNTTLHETYAKSVKHSQQTHTFLVSYHREH